MQLHSLYGISVFFQQQKINKIKGHVLYVLRTVLYIFYSVLLVVKLQY